MPEVSVIIPCFNEEKRIKGLLDALSNQSYASEIEIIIADGMSTDQTRQIIENYSQQENAKLNIYLVDNPKRVIPAALNTAIQHATGKYIIRLDAHSVPDQHYIEQCVHLLDQNVAENVGGIWQIIPGDSTVIARAISLAAAHPLGVGDANYRLQNTKPAFVDTVPFGAFRKSTLTAMGGFNESLLSNEDYELNARIRKNGGKIWLDPNIRCIYFARSTLQALAEQYWRYGYWKVQMLKRYPETIRLRQAVPPLFVLSLLILSIGGIWVPLLRFGLFLEIFLYLFAISSGTFKTAFTQQKAFATWFAMVLSIMTMHFSWGTSFLWAMIRTIFKPSKRAL